MAIPTISSKATPAEVQRFARAVKLFLEQGGFSTQVATQISTALDSYTPPDTGTETDLTPPGAPSNLVVTGGFNHILMTWDSAANARYYQVYRNTADNLAEAVAVSPLLQTTMWVDIPPDSSLSTVYYYWVRGISASFVVGPFNATAGTSGSTADEPGYILEILANEITESELYQTLNDRIDLIDTPSTGLVAKAAELQDQIDTINANVADLLLTPDYDNATTYNDGDVVKYNGSLYAANQTTTGNLPTDATYWDMIGNYATLGDAVAGLAANISSLDSQVTTIDGDLTSEITDRETLATQIRGAYAGTDIDLVSSGLIYEEKTARSTADSSEVSARESLATSVLGATDPTGLTLATLSDGLIYDERQARSSADSSEVTARELLSTKITGVSDPAGETLATLSSGLIYDERQARSTADSSQVSRLDTIETDVYDPTTGLSQAHANITTEATARADGDDALGLLINQVSTKADGNELSIEANITSINGLSGQITFKIDNNGFPAGFGLASETIDGTPFSEFLALADRFAFINPSGTVYEISAMSRLSSTVTVMTSAAHDFAVDDYVVIAGAEQREYNGSHKVTEVVSTTQFRFTVTGTPVTPATVLDGFPGLRAAKAAIPVTIQDGEIVISNALIQNLTATNFAGQTITADELSATLASTYQQIIGWLLQSSDGLVQLDMTNKLLKMEDGSGNYVQMTPGGFQFFKNGSPNPIFEFNGGVATLRDPDGTVLLQSGGNLDYGRVSNGPPAAATIGATWGSNISGQPNDNDLLNSQLTEQNVKDGAGWTVTPADGADVTIDNTSADTLAVSGTAAATVRDNAAGALAATNDMADDGKFTPQEKLVWQYQWPGMDQNYTNILAEATAKGIQAEAVFTNFTSARDTLNTFLVTTHLINAASLTTTTLTGTTFKDNVTSFYNTMMLAVNRLAQHTVMADVTDAGSLATQDTVDWGTDVTNKTGFAAVTQITNGNRAGLLALKVIGGAYIDDLAVDTLKVAEGAISAQYGASSTTTISTTSTSYVDALPLSITVPTAAAIGLPSPPPVVVGGFIRCNGQPESGENIGSWPTVRLVRNTTQIGEGVVLDRNPDGYAFTFKDDPGAGVHIYNIQYKQNGEVGAAVSSTSRGLTLELSKR